MNIVVYSTNTCPICDKTKTLLDKWGFKENIYYQFKKVDIDRNALIEMSKITDGALEVCHKLRLIKTGLVNLVS